jgi:TM2 domain-containing membrane protein YozV
MERPTYTTELFSIVGQLDDEHRNDFIREFRQREKNPAYALGFSVFLGFLGIDRFLVGDWGRGIAKLFSLGGFGLWWFVDTALIAARAREKNIKLANQLVSEISRINFVIEPETESPSEPEPVTNSEDAEINASIEPLPRAVGFRSRPRGGFRSRPQTA